jgi:hypothetical protein
MTAALCVACQDRPTDGVAYACTRCSTRAAGQLRDIADLTPAARDVAHGQTRRGPSVAGASGHGLELNLRAQAILDSVQNTLTSWARHVAAERGITMEAG